jgi:hypothetical protein
MECGSDRFVIALHAEEQRTRIIPLFPRIRFSERASTATAMARGNIQIVRSVQIIQTLAYSWIGR